MFFIVSELMDLFLLSVPFVLNFIGEFTRIREIRYRNKSYDASDFTPHAKYAIRRQFRDEFLNLETITKEND